MSEKAANERIETERLEFTKLLTQNPNYFGNLPDSGLAVVTQIADNTKYEQLTCVGFNPELETLEATVAVKLPFGYGGSLCKPGSTEWVRFFVDWGSGWQDAGLVGLNVHDLPNNPDCAGNPNKPLTYVVTRKLETNPKRCKWPMLPKVRAILSWSVIPPAANPNWPPVWGNTLDRHIQIRPRKPWLIDIFDDVAIDLSKVELPHEFQTVANFPIPLPDPPPPDLAQLARMYGGAKPAPTEKGEETAVEPHRFGFSELNQLIETPAFDQSAIIGTTAQWESIGIDLGKATESLANTKGNTSYEQLDCLGLDYKLDRLVATIHVKKPTGYSGGLCTPGSKEYVAFWVDWDDTCDWTYVGTATVNVHDLPIPPGGLHYAAVLKVDLNAHRRGCSKPKIARVRAVLSWNFPPPPSNPDYVPHWGNRVDTHVQIRPGKTITSPEPIIETIGGVAIEQINTLVAPSSPVAGRTKPTAKFSANDIPVDGYGRDCAFGGRVDVTGPFFPNYQYRIQVRKYGTVVPQELTDEFYVDQEGPGTTHQVADPVTKFFNYLDPLTHDEKTLVAWQTSGLEGLWELRLTLRNPADPSADVHTPWHLIRLKNSLPTADIQISGTGDCKDFVQGAIITGDFVARDPGNFGWFRLRTYPNTATIPSNQPQPLPAMPSTSETAPRVPAVGSPWTGGHEWTLDTKNPISMKACGYVVVVEVFDRTVLNSHSDTHYWTSHETGFCLRQSK